MVNLRKTTIVFILVLLLLPFLINTSKTSAANSVTITGNVYETDSSLYKDGDCTKSVVSGFYKRASTKEMMDALSAAGAGGAAAGPLGALFALFLGAPTELAPDGCVQGSRVEIGLFVEDGGIFGLGVEIKENGKITKTSRLIVSTIENGKPSKNNFRFELRKDPDGTILAQEIDSALKTYAGFSEFLDSPLKFASDKVGGAIANALKAMTQILVNIINKTIYYLSGWIEEALSKDNVNIENTKDAWFQIRNISLTLLSIAIIIIAFANVMGGMGILEQYGAQRLIPKIVINVILVYFSYFIVDFLLEFATILQEQFRLLIGTLGNGTVTPTKGFNFNISGVDIIAEIGSIIFLIIILIGVILALLYLYVILIARIIVIKLLLIVAPVAFVLGVMPFFEKELQRWWNEIFKWIFMGPAVMGVLLIGSIVLKNAGNSQVVDLSKTNVSFLDGFQNILYLTTAGIIYFFAAQIPKTMSGGILPGVGDAVKNKMLSTAGGVAGRNRAVQAWKQSRAASKANREGDAEIRGSQFRTGRVSTFPLIGKRLTGFRDDSERNLAQNQAMDKEVKRYQDTMGNMGKTQLTDLSKSKNRAQAEAAFRQLAENDLLSYDRADLDRLYAVTRISKTNGTSRADGILQKNIKNHPQAAADIEAARAAAGATSTIFNSRELFGKVNPDETGKIDTKAWDHTEISALPISTKGASSLGRKHINKLITGNENTDITSAQADAMRRHAQNLRNAGNDADLRSFAISYIRNDATNISGSLRTNPNLTNEQIFNIVTSQW